MRLKRLWAISLLILLSACTIFKPLPEKEYLINGTFDANFEGRTFEGFFSLNGSNLRLDVINSLGFSVAGIYVSGDTVLVKDYQTGREYKNLKIGDIDLNQYKSLIIYITKNFTELCSKRNGNVVVLRCKKINNTNLPVDFVLVDKSKRLRIGLSKIKMLLKESKP